MDKVISINYEVCTGCGLCCKLCASKAIQMKDNKPEQHKPALCSSCGHCAAMCPMAAITAIPGQPKSFKVFNPDKNWNALAYLLSKKRSVREFTNSVPSRQVLEQLIQNAEKAPSSTNNRHRHYIVITDKDTINAMEASIVKAFIPILLLLNPLVIGLSKLNKKAWRLLTSLKEDILTIQERYEKGNRPVFGNAPCIICIAAPKRDIQAKDDCIIAQQYMMLYGESEGIGSCINGYTQVFHKKIEKQLRLPKGYCIYAVGVFGYPEYTYQKCISYEKEPSVNWV